MVNKMTKLYGLLFLAIGDVLLVRYFTDRKKKTVLCLWEMIGFLGNITYGVTELKRTLKKAITQEKNPGVFPKIFQENFLHHHAHLPLRDAIKKALEELPLPKEATETMNHYFSIIGKITQKNTEESFRHTKLRLEEILKSLRDELPKTQKLISSGIYSISAMVAILLL